MAVSSSDAVKICRHYLISSPPAQISEVEKEVAILAGGSGADAFPWEDMHGAYNIKHSVPLRYAAGITPAGSLSTVLATSDGSIDAHTFVDSRAKRVVSADHKRGTVAVVEGAGEEALAPFFQPGMEHHRAAVCEELVAHVLACYNPAGAGTTAWAKGCEVYAKDTKSLLCHTSVILKNLTNFWSGSWCGRYVLTFSGDVDTATKVTITGHISIVTHYFESGNTQMHGAKAIGPIDIKIPAGDEHACAKAVVAALAAAEDGLQISMDEMYESLSGQALKEMRRFLPVSGSKMNWNIAEHRMRRTLQTSSAAAKAT